MDIPLIEFRNVTKRFNGLTVLDGVNLQINQGEVTTIIGKSGSGKSVLLKHIVGLMIQDEGSILYKGQDIAQFSPKEKKSYFMQISYMFQNNALFDSMTVYENIAFPLQYTTKLSAGEISDKVKVKLEQTELVDMAGKYPAELSGGTQKRVALSRALVTEPQLVLFDEPTTGQDIVRRNAILSMVSEYRKKFGFTAVIISHDIPDIFFISDRILVLHDGKIVFQGTPEELDDFQHPFVDEFIESLEGFEERLTGLYSKRAFKMRYQNELKKNDSSETFIIIAFSVKSFGSYCEKVGYTAGQKMIRALGQYMNKHFSAVGGFSVRQKLNQFITVLPFSDYNEARELVEEFSRDLASDGLEELKLQIPECECAELSVLVNFAEGKSGQDEILDIFKKARNNQKEILRIQIGKGSAS
ncbi:MAG: ATP-binding cassette domain-containing protein [Proteobacteria bacterium]|nr:ATP-binding cassette domain-containing protein [Pseudomonadota bacterium]MBU1710095.1 ATP-binding cassette domain-containing protein [Pseudomonadota bacterium]